MFSSKQEFSLTQILSKEEIHQRVEELAGEIESFYKEDKPLLVGVLKGSFVFLSDLLRCLPSDYMLDFMAVSSYSGDSSSGAVEIRLDLREDIFQRNVLLVEDVVDTGLTLSYIYRTLLARSPFSLRVVTLLLKVDSYRADVPIDFVGFKIPSRFVVGYGMDIDEKFRGLPYIASIEPSIKAPKE
ncbi:MAG TPA: hypoxanthine phosphoribosyltransferase [Fimbriimonadales bacterium]|nr:hypoxanthine phosphoribosyltransferase [Fimbriimonadales bacterium]